MRPKGMKVTTGLKTAGRRFGSQPAKVSRSSGKSMLRRSEQEGLGETAVSLVGLVHNLVSELHPRQTPAVTLDSSLDRDLGLDSLGRMELLARIEKRFGVTVSERVFADAETPRDLLRAVVGASAAPDLKTQERIQAVEAGEAEAAPHSARTLVEVLDWHLKIHPDRSHVRFYADEGEGEVVTYRRLWSGAEAVAAGLQWRGLQPGAPVAIMLPTGIDYLFAYIGVSLAGGVPVSIYPPVRQALLESHLRRQVAILRNCGAVTLITMPEALHFARLLRTQLPAMKQPVTVKELSAGSGAYARPAIGAADTAFLQYTSGSTGNPKGVVLTHANLLANIRAMGKAVEVKEGDVIVSWLPLYHDMGLIGTWLAGLYYAVPVVLLSPLDFLTRPKRWLWAIHRYRGTLSPAPNFAFEICLARLAEEELAGLDLSSWRGAFNGAEPVSPNSVERFCARFAPYGFRREALMPVYGLAESTVGLAFPPCGRGPVIDRVAREELARSCRALPATEGDEGALRFVACGRPLDGHEIRIVDPTGRELPERWEGRVQFRGPSACGGYFRNPDETGRLFDGEWLNTGDLGYIAGGDIYLTGRTKDLIIIAGRNIYPQELEEAVGGLPGIRKGNVVVFGSPDPATGSERLVVVAETRETEPQVLEQLRTGINTLAVELVGNPPDDLILAPPQTVLKTSSGKLRRAACRELYECDLLGKRESLWRQALRLAIPALAARCRRSWSGAATLLYAGYLWTLFGLAAPVVWLAVLLLPRLSWRWGAMRGALRLLLPLSRLSVTVHGAERLPMGRPCVIVANHASYLDAYLLVAALPLAFSFVAKTELQRQRGVSLALRRIGAEFVERFDLRRGVADARRLAGRAREGRSLMFFPEGTFTRVPGLRPFHLGAFIAATEAGVPVVPVSIRGTRSILRDGSWLPRRGAVTIHVGEPVEPEPDAPAAETSSWARALRLRDSARRYILRYCGEPDLGPGTEE